MRLTVLAWISWFCVTAAIPAHFIEMTKRNKMTPLQKRVAEICELPDTPEVKAKRLLRAAEDHYKEQAANKSDDWAWPIRKSEIAELRRLVRMMAAQEIGLAIGRNKALNILNNLEDDRRTA